MAISDLRKPEWEAVIFECDANFHMKYYAFVRQVGATLWFQLPPVQGGKAAIVQAENYALSNGGVLTKYQVF